MVLNGQFKVIESDLSAEFFSAFDMSSFKSFGTERCRSYAALIQDDQIAALAPVYVSDYGVNIEIVEVNPDFRGSKLGLTMIRELFAHTHNLSVEGKTRPMLSTQGFTADGKKYLMPHMDRIEAEFPDVDFGTYPGS